MNQKLAYDEALSSGQYRKVSGMTGKYDNVRRLWEDEIVRLFLQPYLQKVLDRKRSQGEGLRTLDLGCGGADGFELLMGSKRGSTTLSSHNNVAIEPGCIEFYKGIELNPGLVAQAKALYDHNPNMCFVTANFNELDLQVEAPYDLYIASYGTLSHNGREQNTKLLTNIARHGQNGSIIVIDWLGRYSYEWQALWHNDLSQEQWMDYVISYIFGREERNNNNLSHLELALLSRHEVLNIVRDASRQAGANIRVRQLFDRSVLVGRHMDTRDYNVYAQPLRQWVNSLFEPNTRTDLEELLVGYVPKAGFTAVNEFYFSFQRCWNALVEYVIELLHHHDSFGTSRRPDVAWDLPQPLKLLMGQTGQLVSTIHHHEIGDVRANIIEPHLGYALRQLEMTLQQGIGCGHGLVAILEMEKD